MRCYDLPWMTPAVQSLLRSGAQTANAALERLLPGPETPPHSIHRAMRHSVFAGGKRLRPILCMEAARMVATRGTGSLSGETPADREMAATLRGAAQEAVALPEHLPPGAANLGAALEMIHTYSLIHDDLPALDNDDLRRGQPTCHIAFGEAIAVLAGDALQTTAFQVIAGLPLPPSATVRILREIASAIGTGIGAAPDPATPPAPLGDPGAAAPGGLPPGMIGGQVVDIESEGGSPSTDLVEQIHRAKTGALITVSLVAGGMLGLAHREDLPPHEHDEVLARLRLFGENAGLAFQIVDDILDETQDSAHLGKTAGKDTAATKATWPAVFGLEHSRHDAQRLIAEAFAALEPFGAAAGPLKDLAQYLVEREN